MFETGSVVKIFAPQAGYKKYHLCLSLPSDEFAAKFLFINSDPQFDDQFVVPCENLPMIPASETGYSCFSFSMIPRFSAKNLQLYGAENLGRIQLDLARDLRNFADRVRSLSSNDLAFVKLALDHIVTSLEGTS